MELTGATYSYTKYVTKNTGQLETMLKVILAPDDPPEGVNGPFAIHDEADIS